VKTNGEMRTWRNISVVVYFNACLRNGEDAGSAVEEVSRVRFKTYRNTASLEKKV
jgi:hypothetical protein